MPWSRPFVASSSHVLLGEQSATQDITLTFFVPWLTHLAWHSLDTLSRAMRAAIDANAVFLRDITAGKLFEEQYDTAAAKSATRGHSSSNNGCTDDQPASGYVQSSNFDMGKVRSTLRQYAREWSVEGETEREQSFGRLLRYLACSLRMWIRFCATLPW